MSILATGRARGAAQSPTPEPAGAACWVCSAGTGPMCVWCARKVRDTATREAGAPYVSAGDERVRRSR